MSNRPKEDVSGGLAAVIANKKAQETRLAQVSGASSTDKPKKVKVTFRVDELERDHWQIEARKAKTNVTNTIIKSMRERFGTPTAGGR